MAEVVLPARHGGGGGAVEPAGAAEPGVRRWAIFSFGITSDFRTKLFPRVAAAGLLETLCRRHHMRQMTAHAAHAAAMSPDVLPFDLPAGVPPAG